MGRFLESYRESLERYEEELASTADDLRDHASPYPRLALLHGIEQVKAQRRWASRVRRELDLDSDHGHEANA